MGNPTPRATTDHPSAQAPTINDVQGALDSLESALLLGLRADRSDLFAFFGFSASGAPLPAVDCSLFTVAAQAIPGTDDLARSRARDQRIRGTSLWVIANARSLTPPLEARFGPRTQEELAHDIDALPEPYRVPYVLAITAVKDPPGVARQALVASMLDRSDISAIDRTALEAMDAYRRSISVDSCDPLEELLIQARTRSASERLLIADAIRSCLQRMGRPSVDTWCALFAAFDGRERIAMRQAIYLRLRSEPLPATNAQPLHVVAYAAGDQHQMPGMRAALQAIVETTPRVACHDVALFEFARLAAAERDFLTAADAFERFVATYPRDPLAAQAIGVAILLRDALFGAAPSPEGRAALRQLLDNATRTFPDHEERPAWNLRQAELAVTDGDCSAVATAARSFPGRHESAPLMQLMLAEVMLDDRCQLDRALRIAEVDRAMAALDATPLAPALSARWIVLSIRRDLMHSNFDRAQAKTFSFAIDPSVAIEARATALKALLAAYETARRPLALSPDVASELRARGELWWPELRSWFRPLAERIAAMDDAERAAAAEVTFAAIGPLLAPVASKDGDSAWRVRLATALIAAGRDALADTTIDRLFPASESHTVPALLVRAKARLERGDGPSREEAMRLFREAATLVKEESPLWWEAELGQLRVAAASPGTADAVRARIHWLRSLDTTLGGEPIGPRIEALLRSLPDR